MMDTLASYKIMLILGMITKDEFIKYIDTLIIENVEVPYEIVEASLMGGESIDAIVSLVDKVCRRCKIDYSQVKKGIYRQLLHRYESGEYTLGDSIKLIYDFGCKNSIFGDNEFNEIISLEARYEEMLSVVCNEKNRKRAADKIKVDFERFIQTHSS